MPIDVVIASSDRVLRFALTYRAELFPDAPIVFWGLQVPDAATRNAGAGITGVQIGVNFAPTLEFALALQPELRRVFVVANNPDPASTAAARRLLEQVPGVTLTYLEATTVRDLEKAVRAVPAGTAILYLWHSQVQPGEVIYTDEIGRRVTRVSPVPVYSASELLFGHGLVGGVVRSSQETGARVGELAVRVLGRYAAAGHPVRDGAGVAGRGLAGAAAVEHSRVEGAGRDGNPLPRTHHLGTLSGVHHCRGCRLRRAGDPDRRAAGATRSGGSRPTRPSAAATRACAISARGS